jgi:hypothetical protein
VAIPAVSHMAAREFFLAFGHGRVLEHQ